MDDRIRSPVRIRFGDSGPLRAGQRRRAFFIDDSTRRIVASGFARAVQQLGLTVRACAIMNDHVHLLSTKSKHRIEYVAGRFKAEATIALNLPQTPWTKGSWKVFIRDTETIASAARYIEMNPIRAGWEPQHWDFVTPLSSDEGQNAGKFA